jgi:5-methylcytosine-specific restriction endonuclease McrA
MTTTPKPMRPCPTCRQPSPGGRCPNHPATAYRYRPTRTSITNNTYNSEWQHLRPHILDNDNHECVYCGATATTIDHIWPASRGGPTTPHNLAAACQPCNRSKKDSTVEEWIRSGRAPAQAAARVLGNPRFTRTQ